MKYQLLSAALLMAALMGCDKEDDDDNNEPSARATLLTQQVWRFESAGFDLGSNGSVEVDISGQLPACLTDNTLTFTTNGNGTADEGAIKCEATDPQTTPFTWRFTNNETVLQIEGNAIAGVEGGGEFDIVTLSSTQLRVSKDTTFQGLQGALVVSLKH